MYVKNLNQSFNYNKKNPTMDINNEDGNYIAKSQVDVKNLEIFEFKVILIGDPGVGKTSILSRFVTNEFQSVYTSTIGVEFKTKDIYINNTTCASFKIWDTCGQEKFRAITRQYFKNAKGVFLVFDLTNKETIKKLNVWLRDVKENIDNEFFVFLIGNKMDVKDRDISISEEAKQFSNEKKINYYEIFELEMHFENINSLKDGFILFVLLVIFALFILTLLPFLVKFLSYKTEILSLFLYFL